MDDKNRSFSTDNTDDDDYVDMVLDDGTELHCSVIAIFPVEGQQYIALLPDKVIEGYEEDDVFLYRYTEKEGDDVESWHDRFRRGIRDRCRCVRRAFR